MPPIAPAALEPPCPPQPTEVVDELLALSGPTLLADRDLSQAISAKQNSKSNSRRLTARV
jgi:hypothetical protein